MLLSVLYSQILLGGEQLNVTHQIWSSLWCALCTWPHARLQLDTFCVLISLFEFMAEILLLHFYYKLNALHIHFKVMVKLDFDLIFSNAWRVFLNLGPWGGTQFFFFGENLRCSPFFANHKI